MMLKRCKNDKNGVKKTFTLMKALIRKLSSILFNNLFLIKDTCGHHNDEPAHFVDDDYFRSHPTQR